ncbi:histidine--tRNA ligase [candidate division Kazan bacterium RBG_13_50_9]|uniref:Histidine--tRNA ligase n=1 Tax=candidate division Kazan bacterium RBG_13_50_9 TaxID=1798535 RepID=A0A1F4NSA8_UNCK3|nr:MAG: histidine--tRNA ligase [candidate division Kazan bacterium RBG_13_50_9]
MAEKHKKIQAPRGIKDVLPDEQRYWFWLENNFYAVAESAGFERIILPTFEATELFRRSVGEFTDIVSKEMYTFKDRSGNSLTLRPEGTAGAVRAYIEHGMHTLPQPVKLYYWGPMFRYDRPQAGRYREFYQFGLEVLGDSDPIIDALLIQTLVKYYKKLGLKDVVVRINSLGSERSKARMVGALSKFLAVYKKNLCADCKTRSKKNPLRVLDCKVARCQEIIGSASGVMIDSLDEDSRKRFTKVLEALDDMGVAYELDPGLVRGLDYYTHTLFEIAIRGQEDLAIGGGGRYDNLAKQLGGPATPSIGYAGGVERTIDILKQQAVEIPDLAKTDVFVVQLGDRAKAKATGIVEKLEQNSLRVSTALGRGSIQAQLREASRLRSPLVVIIGDQEVHDGNVILRDMNDRSQETVIDRNMAKLILKKLEEKGIRVISSS